MDRAVIASPEVDRGGEPDDGHQEDGRGVGPRQTPSSPREPMAMRFAVPSPLPVTPARPPVPPVMTMVLKMAVLGHTGSRVEVALGAYRGRGLEKGRPRRSC